MQQGNQNYYHPYEEDGNKNDTLNSSDIGVSQSRLSGPDFISFAKQLEYEREIKANSQSITYGWISTSQKLLPDGTREHSNLLVPLPVSKDANTSESLTEFKTERKDVTTLFLIDSKNRDRTAFPRPGNFTLRPPRPYKNVTSIQITQIKLLSSFFYFRASKGNLIIPMVERDRASANNYRGFRLTEAVEIREGTYAVNDLLTEIQTHMNETPLFYDYPNGFTDFVTAFTTNGDLGVNFNEPGDNFYDTLNDKFIQNPTKDYIVKAYWLTRYAGLTTYTIEQIKVAYYYPVLYEVFLDQDDTATRPNLNLSLLNSELNPGETIYIRVVFNAQGLNDPVILELVNNNINLLDEYRTAHTFRYSLVNRYQITYESNTLRVNIFSLTLNTSLLNLFTITRSKSLSAGLQQIGYSSNAYTALSNSLNQAKVVFSDMYNYIQNQLVTYFAIGYATYASEYFVNTNNILYLQNGFNASNIRSGYTLEYLTSGQEPLISTASLYSDSPGYWPRFVPANTGSSAGGIDPSGINISTSLIPYSVTTSNFQFGLQAIDSSNYYIQTNQSTRSVDVVLTIKPARYTVLKFRSPARQTLQVETLPLPYYYRYSDFNKQGLYSNILDLSNNNVPQKYFDLSYSYVYNDTGPTQNKFMDQSNYSSFNLTQPFGTNFSTSYGLAPSLVLNVQSNFAQFQFTAPVPSTSLASTLSVYNTAISFVSLDTSFPGSVEAYVYHDRAAFMADINSNRLRQESPYHFIASSIVTSGNSLLTLNISTFTNNTYYTLFRSSDLAFQNINYKPLVYTTISSFVTIKTDYINFDPKANPTSASNLTNMPFVENYNQDFIRLPTGSNLQGVDPDNTQFARSLAISLKPIGYDISGVSSDLTDYKGYIAGRPGFYPNTQFRVDPLSEYSFQNLSPFDKPNNTYIGPGSLNKILKPLTNAPYTYKTNSNSEIKIVNWYDGYSIPPQANDAFLETNFISTAVRSSFQQYINADGTYETDRQGQIKFGEGIYAIGFLPEDGLYEISSFTFKSVIYPIGGNVNSQDPNTNIQYVGVYSGSYIVNSPVIQISSAITVLKKIGTKTYAPSTLSNTPQFGIELGTFYTFGFDPSFVAASNVKLNGYTQNSNQLLSYDSMYYFVPFNTIGSNVTFASLAGSILPYPLYQSPSTTASYFGQTTKNPIGSIQQTTYILPSTIYNANSNYGPKNGYSLTQYQYEQSQPITTTSIGFRDFKNLIDNSDALFTFGVQFSTSIGTIATNNVGVNTFSTEYDDKLWVVNSLTNMSSITNSNLTFKGMEYASSLSTILQNTAGGTTNSINYLINSPSTLQNYSYSRISTVFNAFTYSEMTGNDVSTTTRSFDLNPNSQFITVWLWGGGGGTSQYLSTNTYGYQAYGGAGAYVKAQINVPLLISNYNTTKVHVVVGKGGLRDNFEFSSIRGNIIGYEQPRYGGGGTSLSFAKGSTIINSHKDDILIQGGGFSGLFVGSNLTTATPLLIVGGGGAAGTDTLGGPGGFGLPSQTYSTIKSLFATITLNASNSPQVTLTGIQDLDNLSVADAFSALSNFIDGNLLTLWNPVSQPYLQPYNYTPYPRTYRTTYNFGSNVSTISRLRFYGNAQGDASHLPTGFIVYNNLTKTQVLYSNTNIGYNDFLYLNNGSFSQNVFDMNLTSPTISTNTILTTGWAVVGTNTSNQLQYSLDGSNWLNAQTSGYRFNSQGGFCIRYLGGIWLAGGNGSSLTLTGIGSNVTAHPSFGQISCQGVTISATGKYQIILSFGRPPYFSTDFGVSWSNIDSLPGTYWKDAAMSVTGEYIAIVSDSRIYISNNYGVTWTEQYITGGSITDVAVSATGKYIYVVSNINYGYTYYSEVVRSSTFGQSWSIPYSIYYGSPLYTIACSGSGQYVTAAFQNYYLLYSSSYLDLYAYNYVSDNTFGKFAMSSSGQYQTVPNGTQGVFVSNNYQSSGSLISLGGVNVYSVAMSATGRYQIAGTANGIYVSTNFGASWTNTSSGFNAYNTALSADGKYALMVPSTGLVYRFIATTPTVVFPYIFYSTNGVTWLPATITEYDGDLIRAFSYLPSKRLWIAGGRSGTCGSFLTSSDGINWTLGGISNPFVSGEALGIRLLNNFLWAVGNGDANGKKSSDGFTWENVPGLQGYDITYGQGKYLATGFNGAPYFLGIIYSPDGINWYSVNPTNLSGFFGLAITFSVTPAEPNGIFTATGISPSLTKVYWSRDGINWYFTFQSSFTANTAYYGVSNGFIGGNAYKAGALLETPAGTYTKKSGSSSQGSYVGAYDTYVYSAQSYTTDLGVVATRAAANSSSPWGSILGFDPTPTALGEAVAYSFVIGFNGLISITANDQSLGSYGQYINSTNLRITYDGTNVRYYINDGLVATVARAIGAPLFVVATFDQVNTSISNIQFGTVANPTTVLTTGTAQWITTGAGASGTGLAVKQTSILRSSDAFTWNTNLIGGYNRDLLEVGLSVDYGVLSVVPNLSTFYVEIQKTSEYQLYAYELQAFGAAVAFSPTSASYSLSNIIDDNLTTSYWPLDSQTRTLTNYPFAVTFSNVVSTLNYLQFYSVASNQQAFTSIEFGTSLPAGPLFTLSNIASSNFSTTSGVYLYQVPLIPALSNVSSFYINLGKTTASSINLTEIRAIYDQTNAINEFRATSVVDLDNRGGFSTDIVTKLIDGSLATIWNVGSWNINTTSQTIRLVFSFSTTVTQLNHIQVYNWITTDPFHTITGIGVYTDTTKTTTLYSNASISAVQYLTYRLFDFDITPVQNVTSIYVELTKLTAYPNYQPYLNEVKFYNIGASFGDIGGYTGGYIQTMVKLPQPITPQTGGGGSEFIGGRGGIGSQISTVYFGSTGTTYKGGSPAPYSGNAQWISSFLYLSTTAGGGGGGYQGGGGGGTSSFINALYPGLTTGAAGGAGGGGGGFFSTIQSVSPGGVITPLITLLEYGTALPGSNVTPSNYISPGLGQQSTLIGSNVISPLSATSYYAYGGRPSVENGAGGHGLVIVSYEAAVTVNPAANSLTANPVFVDSSKLSLFQAPVITTDFNRTLTFGTYTDPIQYTSYSGLNWVWYRAFLSFVGGILLPSMTPNIVSPSYPVNEFPHLPTLVYDIFVEQFNNVRNFFNRTNFTYANATSITNALAFGFQLFQVNFVVLPYTSPFYIEFTEIYCLLDYLQGINNLMYPHVSPINATIDRVFGGIPRFGYWANPFLKNVTFVGFDIAPSLLTPSTLVGLVGASNPVQMQAMYGLAIEQNLSSGSYVLKDIMSYKPNLTDIQTIGSNWLRLSQMNESFSIRTPESEYMNQYLSVQPYDFKNALEGKLPLFNYKTYYTSLISNNAVIQSPIHMINDFEGSQIFFYSYQNSNIENRSSLSITHYYGLTSSLVLLNEQIVLNRSNSATEIIGTVTRETPASTLMNSVNKFGYTSETPITYYPDVVITPGSNNYYNTYSPNSEISSIHVGRFINDINGNIYVSNRSSGVELYQNICTIQIYQKKFTKTKSEYASPSQILGEYRSGTTNPYYDFFYSKYNNIWHIQGTENMSTLYGARLNSPYDFTVTTSFLNQVFCPSHKITLIKKAAGINPIVQTEDLTTYPWYPHTEMFFYKNFSSLTTDISGQFALEKTSNFAYKDMFSGYFFNSFINNINLDKSTYYNNGNDDSFNYLAVRAYSPSEQFKCLLRMYLPGRYDFGFVTIRDLSNEYVTVQNTTIVNPDYRDVLNQFNTKFQFTSRAFGSTGLPGFPGSNISSVQFGDFLRQYINIYNTIQTNQVIVTSVTTAINTGITNLVTGDLRYILPSTIANRERIEDPLEFKILFSTVVVQNTSGCETNTNRSIDEYGLGYNLGFAKVDTEFNTIQRANSFFKILDDYIYLRMNPEYNMNRLDISRQENFATTQDPTSESQLYNCKLLLNTFGSYAQTVIQNPVFFNPPIGKLDKLSFQWYDITGTLIDNIDCEWSGAIQVTERTDVATADSTLPK